MSKITSYRQGDVLLVKVDSKDLVLSNELISPILSEGEVTGHKHEIINGTVHNRQWNSLDRYVKSDGGTVLTHPEHGHIKINKGIWEVRIQREYDELENRFVAD
jgi:hypothetical protein